LFIVLASFILLFLMRYASVRAVATNGVVVVIIASPQRRRRRNEEWGDELVSLAGEGLGLFDGVELLIASTAHAEHLSE
jgi:hypothetical protein